jgi:TM2 domain-containing membrane protein YozV
MAGQAGQGSAGNVIAAVCSFFIPGLGQLVQGRLLAALMHFVVGAVVWFITFGTLGWIVNVLSALEAALWKPKGS